MSPTKNKGLFSVWTQIATMALIGVLLVGYTAFRAHEIAFTYDESNTVLVFVQKNYHEIFEEAPTATNHMLNTALAKAASSILPPHELTYRLPNVLAHVMYLLFVALLVWRLPPHVAAARMFGFLLLCCNPYMLDFFSLCRGYGLALAFTLGAIFFWLKHVDTKNFLWLTASLLFAGLAVLSNFSLLNLYLGICALYFLHNFCEIIKTSVKPTLAMVKNSLIVLAVSFLLFLIIKNPIIELLDSKELFFGGYTGLWSDTVMSIISKSTYSESSSSLVLGVGVAITLLTLISIVIAAYKSASKFWRQGLLTDSLQITVLLSVILIGLTFQHHVLGTLYLIERTALFLLPIYILAFVYSVQELKIANAAVKSAIIGVPALLLTVHTLSSINLTHTLDWKYERSTKKLMQSLQNQGFNHAVSVGVNWPNTEAFRFYKWLYRFDWMDIVENPGSTPYESDKFLANTFYAQGLDLAFSNNAEIELFAQLPSKTDSYPDKKVLVWFPSSDMSETVYRGNWKLGSTQNIEGNEFYELISDSLHHFINLQQAVNLKIEVALKPDDNTSFSDIHLVLTIGSEIYESTTLNPNLKRGDDSLFRLYFKQEIPADAAWMKVYLWNSKKQSFTISDFTMSVFENKTS